MASGGQPDFNREEMGRSDEAQARISDGFSVNTRWYDQDRDSDQDQDHDYDRDHDVWTAPDTYKLVNARSTFNRAGAQFPPQFRAWARGGAFAGGAMQILCGVGVGVLGVVGGLTASLIYFTLLAAAASFVASGALQIAQVYYATNSFPRALYQIVASLSLAAALGLGLLASILMAVLYGYHDNPEYAQFVNESPYIKNGEHELMAAPFLFFLSLVEFVILITQMCFDSRCAI